MAHVAFMAVGPGIGCPFGAKGKQDMDGLSWEAIGVVVAATIGLGSLLIGIYVLLLKHSGKLSAIASTLIGLGAEISGLKQQLEKHADQNREDHGRMWTKLDDHEKRITRLEK